MENIKLKKALIICSSFPPLNSIAALRLSAFAYYLPELGYYPVVCTVGDIVEIAKYGKLNRQFSNINLHLFKKRNINTILKYKFMEINNSINIGSNTNNSLNKNKIIKEKLKYHLSNIYRALFYFPDPFILWHFLDRKKILNISKSEKVNLIFSSSPGPTCHIIANYISKHLNIPWVADYRDHWSLNPIRAQWGALNKFNLAINKKLEIKTLKRANTLISVTNEMREELKKLHHKKVYNIPNGFDPLDLESIEEFFLPFHKNSINIVYTGKIYPKESDPSIIFLGLYELIKSGKVDKNKILFHFWGHNLEIIRVLSQKYGLSDIINIYNSYLSHNQALYAQKKANILLLLSKAPGQLTGKIFEYLVSKNFVIATGFKGGAVDRLLQRTKAGILVDSVSNFKQVFLEKYNEFSITGKVKCNSDYKYILMNFSRREQTKKLAKIFNDLLNKEKDYNEK